MTKRYRVVHVITEGDDPEPVVVHHFYGTTKDEALHVYEAHRKSDAFLRSCDDEQQFEGRLRCQSVHWLEVVR